MIQLHFIQTAVTFHVSVKVQPCARPWAGVLRTECELSLLSPRVQSVPCFVRQVTSDYSISSYLASFFITAQLLLDSLHKIYVVMQIP